MTMATGLRSKAKAMELPPAPNVRAPALDPTCERLGVKLPGATLPAAAPLNSLERVKVVVFAFVFILVGDRETSGME